MGINFPNAPTLNQLYPQPSVPGLPVYRWDGEKWTTGVTDSSPGHVRYDVAQSLTSPQLIQARQNIYAAPFDAMAYNGLQLNGGMEVSQENGSASVGITTGVNKFIVDGWRMRFVSSVATFAGQQAGVPFPGFRNALLLMSGTGMGGSLAIGDVAALLTAVEGTRWARLGWGGGSPMPITIVFYLYATMGMPQTGTLCVQNAGQTRSYFANFTLTAANTWTRFVITVPGDSGTPWTIDSAAGTYIWLCFGSGTTNAGGTNGAWVATGFIATPQTTNWFASNGQSVYMTGFGIWPGNEAPSAERHTFIMRPYDQELVLCQRHFWMRQNQGASDFFTNLQAVSTTTCGGAWLNFPYPMRAAPNVTISAPGDFALTNNTGSQVALTSIGGFSSSPYNFRSTATVGAATFTAGQVSILGGLNSAGWIKADARI